jgi:hypothetical protein
MRRARSSHDSNENSELARSHAVACSIQADNFSHYAFITTGLWSLYNSQEGASVLHQDRILAEMGMK